MFYLVYIFGLFLTLTKNNKYRSALVFTSILFLMAIFRYGIGTDFFGYKILFLRLQDSPLSEWYSPTGHGEIGFRLMGATLKMLGVSFQIYLGIFALVSLLFLYKLIKKFSLNPMLSCLVFYAMFYFVWILSGVRQGLTMSVGIYFLLHYFEKNQFLRLIFVSVLLSFIHVSVLILIPIYLLLRLDWNLLSHSFLLIVSLVFAILPIGGLFSYFYDFPFGVGSLLSRYGLSDGQLLNIMSFQAIGRYAFILVLFLFYNQYKNRFRDQKVLLDLMLIFLSLYFALQFTGELVASRISEYGLLLFIIVLPNIIYTFNKKTHINIIYAVSLIFTFGYFSRELNIMTNQVNLDGHDSIPYIHLWNYEEFRFNNRYKLRIIDNELFLPHETFD